MVALAIEQPAWGPVREYNELRPHRGQWCYETTTTPMQTVRDSLPLAKDQVLPA